MMTIQDTQDHMLAHTPAASSTIELFEEFVLSDEIRKLIYRSASIWANPFL